MNSGLRWAGALGCLWIMVALLGGCATSGGGAVQLGQTRDNVDWAMVRYHNRAEFGFMTPTEAQQVGAAYKAYQTAFNEAVKQANGNFKTPTPADVLQLADQLYSVLASIP